MGTRPRPRTRRRPRRAPSRPPPQRTRSPLPGGRPAPHRARARRGRRGPPRSSGGRRASASPPASRCPAGSTFARRPILAGRPIGRRYTRPMAPVVDRYVLGAAQENCYLVRADRGAPEGVVVDPGDAATELRLELARAGARCAAILVTHCHYDHIGAVADLAEGTGAPVYTAREEAQVMAAPDQYYGALGVHVRPYEPDVLLDGGETFEVAGLEFETLLVPGHSPAHLAFATDGCLFSGDVLFE